MHPPTPPNETERLAALERYRILDTPPEEAFDRIARLAARLFAAPLAGVSLVDATRQWFKATHGLEIRETPRDATFCAHAILSDEVLVVPDAAADPRFREYPVVQGPPGVCFYAGAPLIAPDGYRLGALVILDTVPRAGFSGEQRQVLAELAAAVVDELEFRRAALGNVARVSGKVPLTEDLLAAILDALPVGVWVADKEGRLLLGNPASQEIWGGGRYVGLDAYDEYVAWWPDTGKRLQAQEWALARAIRWGEASLEEVIEIQAFDGRKKIILNSAVPLRGPSGELVGGLAVNQDITEERRSQEALHRLGEELRGIVDASPLAIISFGRDRRVRAWSPAAEQMFGWSAEEVIGQPYPIVPEEYEEQFQQYCGRGFQGEVLRDIETVRRRKDGTLLDVRISAAPLHSSAGEIAGVVTIISDITAGKVAERALLESEDRYRNLVESSPIGVVIHSEGRIVYCNRAAIAMFGGSKADDLLGRSPVEFVRPESLAQFHERTRAVLESGRAMPAIEVSMLRLDGGLVFAEVAPLPFTYQGRPAVQVVMRDISDRKRAEEEAREHQRDLSTLVDNLPAYVVVKDRDSNFLVANRKYCQTMGITPEQVRGKTDFDFVERDMALKYRADDARVIASGETLYFEESLRLPDGRTIEIGTIKAPLRDENGAVRGLVAMVFELTEMRAMEAALRQSEERFRKAVLDAPIPIMIHAEGGRILQVNQAWLEQSEYRAEDLGSIGDWLRTAQPEASPEVRERVESLYKLESKTEGHEAPIRTASGKIRTWAFSSAPLGPMPDGARVVITMAMDVTERRSLEQQLAQSRKMEAVGLLAGGVAHDFNNLLTVISGYATFLLQTLRETDPAVTQVKEIVQAAERAADLTRQLLAFSRKQILRPANVDLNAVIRESERMLRRLISEDIEIRMELAPVELRALVDPGQLTQVIINLAVNARDAMPEGGVLSIETAPVELPAEYTQTYPGVPPGAYSRLEISDTGVGMDRATRERIFDPFFTTKRTGSGTGLGLSTVYGIVKQSNGHITVDSEPGRGATFHIYLPRIFERPEAPEPQPQPAPAAAAGQTVLLVEDDPALRKLTHEILRRAGHKVIETANGGEALLACEQTQEPIALMITDLVMPGMSGREVAKRLESLRPEMKVLYMSGYSSHSALATGILEGQVPFLQKPFSPTALVAKVRQVLTGN